MVDNISEYSFPFLGNNTNTSSNNASDKYTHVVTSVCIVLILGLIVCLAVFGNVLVIISVWKYRRLKTVTNYFIVSLALSDLLLSVFVLPLSIVLEITGVWIFGIYVCDMWTSFDVLLCTASIMNLCCISLDRYFAITRPLVYSTKRSKKLARIMIAFVWCLSILITCPPIFGWKEDNRNANNTICRLTSDPGYIIYSASGSFFIPLIVMIFVYARIYSVTQKREKFLRPYVKHLTSKRKLIETCTLPNKDNDINLSTVSNSGDASPIQSKRKCSLNCIRNGQSVTVTETDVEMTRLTGKDTNLASNQKFNARVSQRNSSSSEGDANKDRKAERLLLMKESKTAKTIAIVIGCFVFCWLPFFLVYLIQGLCAYCDVHPALFSTLTWLGYINSAVNPLIYAWYSREFRLAFWRLTCGRCRENTVC